MAWASDCIAKGTSRTLVPRVLTSDKLNGERRASRMVGAKDRRNRSMLDGNQGSVSTQDFSTG